MQSGTSKARWQGCTSPPNVGYVLMLAFALIANNFEACRPSSVLLCVASANPAGLAGSNHFSLFILLGSELRFLTRHSSIFVSMIFRQSERFRAFPI